MVYLCMIGGSTFLYYEKPVSYCLIQFYNVLIQKIAVATKENKLISLNSFYEC
jgi:hypothetical protein